jgi:NAD(P)-dependent dehydrogenase (short-subunit alcohol dehydrogenase family)
MCNRTALVTGATRGIGLQVALALAKMGFNLILNGRKKEADVANVLRLFDASGVSVHYIPADIGKIDDCRYLINTARRIVDKVDVLVNNAGVAPKQRKDILEIETSDFDEVLDVNLRGPFFLTQMVAKWMLEKKEHYPDWCPAIIFITSVSAEVVSLNRAEYCISKAALSMAAKLFAARLAGFDIKVFEVRPGIIDTDMIAPARSDYLMRIKNGIIPVKRLGRPEEVAQAVASLIINMPSFATGSVIYVDGGLHINRL